MTDIIASTQTELKPELRRSLGPTGVMLLTLSALSPVGSVYIGGAGVLHLAGTGAAVGYVAGGVISAVVSLLCAELGASFPAAGGLYPSFAHTVGRGWAFAYMIMGMISAPLFMAFAAFGLANYARVLFPVLPHVGVVIAGLVAATAIAVLSVRTSALVTGLFLAVEAVALLMLTGVALTHPLRSAGEALLHPVMLVKGALVPTPPVVMGLAVVAGVWSTAGATWALYFGEDMHDAPRRMGRVVAWAGVIAAATIAIPVLLVVMATPNVKGMLGSEAPIAAFLQQTAGPVVTLIVSAGVLAAIFNNLVAASMGLSRFLYSTARDRIWPDAMSRFVAHLHPRLGSPLNAAVLLAVVSFLCSLLGERTLIVLLAGDVSYIILSGIAVMMGRRRGQTGAHYKVIAHPVIPVLALLVAAASVAANLYDPDAGRPSTFILGAVFLVALLYYWRVLSRRVGGWQVYESVYGETEDTMLHTANDAAG